MEVLLLKNKINNDSNPINNNSLTNQVNKKTTEKANHKNDKKIDNANDRNPYSGADSDNDFQTK